jgi:hypothetical protein
MDRGFTRLNVKRASVLLHGTTAWEVAKCPMAAAAIAKMIEAWDG